jgi:hypothetical protein
MSIVSTSAHTVGVDYLKLVRALDFYASRGFVRAEVPWLVSKEAMRVTLPKFVDIGSVPRLGDGMLVGSAEQSFIECLMNGTRAGGTAPSPGCMLMAATPCYRHEAVYDDYRCPGFVKLELFHWSCEKRDLDFMIEGARRFFAGYGQPVKTVETEIGYDLEIDGHEVGSYGFRDTAWGNFIYGTGLAEPRLSAVLAGSPPGYALRDVRRAHYGTLEKIEEEMDELRDSEAQGNRIMSLVEASDVYGALEGWAESNGTSIEELAKMSEATKRAFTSGRRK